MKKLAYVLFFSVSFLLIGKRSQAQDYQTAVGLKFGAYEVGPSIKYFMDKNTALEGIIGIRDHGVVITGLYEIHQPAFNVDKLNFYYGFGGHLGSIGRGGFYKRIGGDDEYYDGKHILIGADATLGLEYKIPEAPIAISLDLNPRLELARGPFFDIAPGLGLKYTF
ncbi:hypothetical protein [Mucilaginibacter pocheonensis]|uniref:Outer membrane insertion C-terminal signal n=1 Tax=Mucilaginibacter pocheonensis TaxID=398050 RepID=A0ABU1T4P5_9SPHI|nr:hypothetical protein [Mucilaginibacter pocheonensis]MDR6940279.1 hypothetical protein [Mucilaginibacter pocheonensis]